MPELAFPESFQVVAASVVGAEILRVVEDRLALRTAIAHGLEDVLPTFRDHDTIEQ